MACNRVLFTSLVECNKRKVTLGDGVTAKIYGKDTKDCVSMTNFENVIYVEI